MCNQSIINRAFQALKSDSNNTDNTVSIAKDILALCDHLRDNDLPKLGVTLEDTPGNSSRWFIGQAIDTSVTGTADVDVVDDTVNTDKVHF